MRAAATVQGCRQHDAPVQQEQRWERPITRQQGCGRSNHSSSHSSSSSSSGTPAGRSRTSGPRGPHGFEVRAQGPPGVTPASRGAAAGGQRSAAQVGAAGWGQQRQAAAAAQVGQQQRQHRGSGSSSSSRLVPATIAGGSGVHCVGSEPHACELQAVANEGATGWPAGWATRHGRRMLRRPHWGTVTCRGEQQQGCIPAAGRCAVQMAGAGWGAQDHHQRVAAGLGAAAGVVAVMGWQ